MRHSARIVGLLSMVLLMSAVAPARATEFQTSDPLKAFVRGEYRLGSDYFIHGKDNTVLFRCILTKPEFAFEGIALSEYSIWGNHGGDWEIFRKRSSGAFVYVGTKYLENCASLESCRSSEYLASGRCTWQRGWKDR
jgi:hypothetical protein